ncbi:histidine phosphatase family protein [Trinickia sp. LjRoot230]|uniref:histidine phosphatase family protein n=1 Tax=Trinickia sp. LjRoot230 TaxID=3342288 RepID=UPI003ECDF756
MSTRILFVRHGETAWNQIKRIQGHIDVPLAESGHAQARRLANRLASAAVAGEPIGAIYSSDLARAQQTAQPTATALGLPVTLAEGLRERDYGVFQGHDSTEIAARFPDAYAIWQTRDPGFVPEGGESSRMFYRRVAHAIEAIVAAHPGGRIACVTHGGVLDCIYRRARALPLDAPRDYPLLNASINTVEFDEVGAISILAWADIDHLEAASDDDGLVQQRAVTRTR